MVSLSNHEVAPPCRLTLRRAQGEDLESGAALKGCNHRESLGQLFVDFEVKVETIRRPEALVAELVDAQVSGTCGREVVEVRVFSRAPSVVRRDEH
jgi:hypothetical protein